MDTLQVKLLIVGLYDQEFFELVKFCPWALTGQVKVACPDESLTPWTINFE